MSENEINVGDEVLIPMHDEAYTVEHIRGKWAWIFAPDSDSGRVRKLSDLKKVAPKWEAGVTYRRKASGWTTYTVTAVDEGGNALALDQAGTIYGFRPSSRLNYEECE